VTEPWRNDDMATAIVTESINKHSWTVDPKHSGRASGRFSVIGCTASVDWPPSLGSDMATRKTSGWLKTQYI
jgi:hypothetical protein